jgi:hypothetical protein
MVAGMQTAEDDASRRQDALRHSFALLAGAELRHWPEWAGPDDALSLRARVAHGNARNRAPLRKTEQSRRNEEDDLAPSPS